MRSARGRGGGAGPGRRSRESVPIGGQPGGPPAWLRLTRRLSRHARLVFERSMVGAAFHCGMARVHASDSSCTALRAACALSSGRRDLARAGSLGFYNSLVGMRLATSGHVTRRSLLSPEVIRASRRSGHRAPSDLRPQPAALASIEISGTSTEGESTKDASIYRTEIMEQQKIKVDILKWKLFLAAGLGAAGIGLADRHAMPLLLALVPLACTYVDIICYHSDLRILVIAHFLRHQNDDRLARDYELCCQKQRRVLDLDHLAMYWGTFVLSLFVIVSPWMLRASSSEAEWDAAAGPLAIVGCLGLLASAEIRRYYLAAIDTLEDHKRRRSAWTSGWAVLGVTCMVVAGFGAVLQLEILPRLGKNDARVGTAVMILAILVLGGLTIAVKTRGRPEPPPGDHAGDRAGTPPVAGADHGLMT